MSGSTITNVIAGATGAAASVRTGKVGNVDVDGILIRIDVSGSGGVVGDLDNHKFNATFKPEVGDPIILFDGTRIRDLAKISDQMGGYSIDGESAFASANIALWIPVGNIMMAGDDSLELQLTDAVGDASAIYTYRIGVTDVVTMREVIMGYELITGNGAEQVIKNCNALYLVSAAAGNDIAVSDQEKSQIINDYDAVALANAIGRSESFQDLGIINNDSTELSQNMRVKLPSGAYAVACKTFYLSERVGRKYESMDNRRMALLNKIRIEDPIKYNWLVESGAAD